MRKLNVRIMASACAAMMFVCFSAAACGETENVPSDEYKITLDFNDGVSRDGSLYVGKGDSVALPADPAREGYAFGGWETETGEAVSDPFTPAGDTVLVAKWEAGVCNVTFDLNYEDSSAVTREFAYGSFVSDPPAPERDGHTFRFWSTTPNGSEVDFSSYPVNGDYTFYAIWRRSDIWEYTVTFSAGTYEGAPGATSKVVLEGEQVNSSDAPRRLTREGYEFQGWTAEQPENGDWTIDTYPAEDLPALVEFPYAPSGNVTLHAVWTIGRYAAIFNVNFTDCEEPNGIYASEYYLSNQNVQAPAPPARQDYTFDGWYTAARGGTKVDLEGGVRLTANAIYYAHWKHDAVVTDVFQAEYVEFDPTWIYYGYSSSVLGAKCIVPDMGSVGTVMVDEYPLNSKLTAPRNGYFVSYQYEYGCKLRFEITSSEATEATLVGSFAKESDLIDVIGPSGDSSNLILVNGVSLDYAPMTLKNTFEEYTLGKIQLQKGLNVIEIVVNNHNTAMGVTYRAVGFMTDYLKITDHGTATLSWSPIYDNLEVVN